MEVKEILRHVDHTYLKMDATWTDVRTALEDGLFLGCASVFVPPAHVHKAADYVEGSVKVGSVIGFPYGYETTRTKCYEAVDLVKDGADEIDMVVNVGWVKEGMYDRILSEIRAIRAAIDGEKAGIVFKVIIETCLLTDEEKIRLCEVISESGADYIKTSTGFNGAGATFADVELFAKHVSNGLKIKAAGGISSLEDAEKFLSLGADRIGTSRIVKIVKSGGTDTGSGY